MSLSVVILAAGGGSRMRSSTLPKVLHPIGGVPILSRILSTVSQINPNQVIVVSGNQSEELKVALAQHSSVVWAKQDQPLGTGHAALKALPLIKAVDRVLILYGDIPLITVGTLNRLLKIANDAAVGLITKEVSDPTGLGRIVRDPAGRVLRIVEERDATPEEKKNHEINTGFFVAPKQHLQKWLTKLTADNTQQEYYLTDIINMANQEEVSILTVSPQFEWEVLGVNDKVQLANLERIFQKVQAESLMQQGVTLLDPARFDVRGEITVGKDVVIDINVILEGRVTLGNNVSLGSNVCIKDAVIQDNVQILSNSIIESATIGENCSIGPFARIRPGTVLAEGVKIGNFVEIKNTVVGAKSKINHLSYMGDAAIGQEVNVGAGTITCNFDGNKKHKTIIGDQVSIGSDTQLIAPITVGKGVTIGAGTTVTRDIPPHSLVHNRVEQRSVANWKKIEEDKE